ncbi:MAG: hypothetical protein OXD30_00910, partial [Bryobacterales bacterium]|nr:hypothetical protein [Bryobacterales bacterium]
WATARRRTMKKYIVRLTEEERKSCEALIDKLAGSSQKARHAQILKQVDADAPNWTDQQDFSKFLGSGSVPYADSEVTLQCPAQSNSLPPRSGFPSQNSPVSRNDVARPAVS